MMKHPFQSILIAIAASTASTYPGLTSCELDLGSETTPADQAESPIDDGLSPSPEDTVTIRFRNLTVNEAIDVEFHASSQPLVTLPDDLLNAENLVTSSIGVAGTGIIQPLTEDTILYPCAPDLTIGTAGGSFLDHETGEPRGSGTPRWVEEGPLALCGGVVTFEFAGDGTDFSTILTVGR